jgi:membrane-associated phospholipid phosphatase
MKMRRWRWGAVCVAGAFALGESGQVRAAEPEPPVSPGAEGEKDPAAFDAGQVHWRDAFRRVGWPEYVAVPVLLGGVLAAELAFPEKTSPRWTGPILFDRALQHLLRSDSAAGRRRANLASGVLVGVSAAQLAVDAWLVAAGIRQNADVAWQLTVIDAQAYALSEFTVSLTKQLAGRERPYGELCPGDAGSGCASKERYRSFFSGHSSSTATFAGLTCAHHQKLALYGSFAADLGACIGAIGVTLATGMLRIAADKHWASDVLVGHAVGFSSGYLLTGGLYYREGASSSNSVLNGALLPIVGSGVWGLAWGGAL